MKGALRKAVSVCLTTVLAASAITATTLSASAATSYYNTYSTVANVLNRNSCSAMQGMAVGSTYLYTVKIKDNNSSAVLQKTNKNTGKTTNLTDSNGSATYSYLNHANDMDVTTIDGYSQLFIATMKAGSTSLVRMKINGSKATKSGSYTIMLNGAQKSVSAVSIESTTDTHVNFLFKVGTQLYRGSVAKSATSGTINITPAFKINTSSVKVNGSTLNLSSYTHQGMGYYKGKLFVPLWGGGAGKSNQAIIAVYDIANASGTITSDPNLSFRITSSAYTGFEIESCDISSDGKLYFNANRWNSKSGNYDGIFCFNGYVFTEPSTPVDTTSQPETSETTSQPETSETTSQPETSESTTVTYYPKCSSSASTIIEGLNSIGVDSSKAFRTKIAAANNIADYSGTAAQNTQMLNLLKQGKLIDPSGSAATSQPETSETTSQPETSETVTVTYYPKCSSSASTIVEGLNSIGVDSSKAFRTKIAAANDIANYSGTAAQNTQMLNLLKQGKLIKP
ncbi:MAG: hypothetical protein ACI4XP_06410 [Acutalibacteraceae bacterium]